jgi:N-ethylmaleimide reductase
MIEELKRKLFDPIQIGVWSLRNRTVMAPITRCFADEQSGVVGTNVVEYYRKRAADGIGLIITEGIMSTIRGKGSVRVPGLYSQEQTAAWKKVTDAVHNEGGTIIAQLWHAGRKSHSELTGGYLPQAPSPIKMEGYVPRLRKPYEVPEEMSLEDINATISNYVQAAGNAIAAGFDGVEVHGAHGYLIDSFNSDLTNIRKDCYGGDFAQRLTFMKEVITAVINKIGVDRTIVRFSMKRNEYSDYFLENPEEAVRTLVAAFKEVGVKFIHPSTDQFTRVLADGKTLHQLVRKYWNNLIIGVGDLTATIAEQALQESTIDLAAFGRPLIANPDFLHRIKHDEELIEYEAKVHLKTLV